jgi:hypothetical protein
MSLSVLYMPRLHLLPSRISKFSGRGSLDPPPTKSGGTSLWDSPILMPMVLGDMPVACPVSAYFQKFSIYLKNFLRTLHTYICIRLKMKTLSF